MTAATTLSELRNRRVVALDDATEVGEVKNIVVDRTASRVERVQVAGRKRSPELVDWDRVRSVGDDAVMIASADAVHESRDEEDDDSYVRGDIPIVGAQVTTTQGFSAGEVTDLHIDTSSGDVLAAMTTEGRVSADRIKSLGTFGLIIT